MKWGFILVTLYMGPLGLLLYVLADKEPRPGSMARMSRPIIKKLMTGAMPAIMKFMLMNSGMKLLRTFSPV